MSQMVPSELAGLAERINDHHGEALAHVRHALVHARAAGGLLLEAKRRCPHGTWLPWLRDNVACSERTAQAYMRVASRWPELEAEAKSAGAADLTIEGALKLLAAPAEPQPEAADDAECFAGWTPEQIERYREAVRQAAECLVRIREASIAEANLIADLGERYERGEEPDHPDWLEDLAEQTGLDYPYLLQELIEDAGHPEAAQALQRLSPWVARMMAAAGR